MSLPDMLHVDASDPGEVVLPAGLRAGAICRRRNLTGHLVSAVGTMEIGSSAEPSGLGSRSCPIERLPAGDLIYPGWEVAMPAETFSDVVEVE